MSDKKTKIPGRGAKNKNQVDSPSPLKPKELKLQALMIEDNPNDAKLLKGMLAEESDVHSINLVWSRTLKQGLKELEQGGFDVILLDLNLPDSDDLSTVKRTYEKSGKIPIIVLTGIDDEVMASNALHAGAQDYLVKGQLDRQLILRAIRYTMERQQLLNKLEEAREKEERQKDLNFLERISGSSTTKVTAQSFGVVPLRQCAPRVYDECVELYKVLMDQALVQKAYKVNYPMSEKLRKMAETIGLLKGGPRDVIEIYTNAFKKQSANVSRPKAQALMEEGRILVLELMGYLVSFYRNYYMDFQKRKNRVNEE